VFITTAQFAAGQSTLNNYKYAVVPSRFSFLKQKDEYRLNTLTKLLLEKYGFTAYLDSDAMPEDLLNYNCNRIFVDVESVGNFVNTKIKVTLRDCKNHVLFTSAEGRSKEKEYNVAYNQALRQAFESFRGLNYKYEPKVAPTNSVKNETIPSEKTILNETFDASEPVLYAKPIANGYQLVDAKRNEVMKIFKTSSTSNFIATKGTLQGALVLKEKQWYFEYYQDEKLVSEKVNVNF
jgi:hypothetical protein